MIFPSFQEKVSYAEVIKTQTKGSLCEKATNKFWQKITLKYRFEPDLHSVIFLYFCLFLA